jgi:phosphatidylserine/phosphatidylglycerophosphate/cardiolipin synthase-like enzyme
MRINKLTAVVLIALSTVALVEVKQTTPMAVAADRTAVAERSSIKVYFSPNGGCTEAVVSELNNARKTIDVQAYSFTSAPIAEAVAKASERGVKVRVILDKSQQTEKYSSLTYLQNHNVPTWVDSKHAIAHNKIMIIDGQTLLTGSFNFTKGAEEKNAENLLVIRGEPELLKQYQANFEEHRGHSKQQ